MIWPARSAEIFTSPRRRGNSTTRITETLERISFVDLVEVIDPAHRFQVPVASTPDRIIQRTT